MFCSHTGDKNLDQYGSASSGVTTFPVHLSETQNTAGPSVKFSVTLSEDAQLFPSNKQKKKQKTTTNLGAWFEVVFWKAP